MLDSDTLIQHYLDGTLTKDEAGQLHRLLEAQPELGGKLIQHLEMDEMIRAAKPLATNLSILPALPLKRRRTIATVTSLAACVGLLGTWLGLLHRQQPEEEQSTTSVAVFTRGVNLEWESASIAPGAPLSPGLLKLKSGFATIEFYQGASVVLEGPAEFQLISGSEATCTSGKLTATVPPQAIGFRINTPKGSVVDLGTAFGLQVNETSSEVHVFDGEVFLHKASEPIKMVKEGQAMSFAANSPLFAANPVSFASLNAADALTDSAAKSQLKLWREQSTKMRSDPGLKVHFNFQDGKASRSLHNHAPQGDNGSIVGAAWTEGRWPGKHALEFRTVSDRVRLSVPGETQSLTMALSVRINGLDRPCSSLFMSDGWTHRKIHWQILKSGEIRFGVAVASSQGSSHFYNTPVFFTPERFGSWVHLAVVFDPAAKELRHYANGSLLARHPLVDSSPLNIGIGELGNWNKSDDQSETFKIRYLSGAMDEFALWDRVLSDAEIAAFAK